MKKKKDDLRSQPAQKCSVQNVIGRDTGMQDQEDWDVRSSNFQGFSKYQ